MALIRRRKKEVEVQEYTEFPRGGHVPNSPESCQWRKKFEASGKFWTETYFCGYRCDEAVNCPAYLNYQRSQRDARKGNR